MIYPFLEECQKIVHITEGWSGEVEWGSMGVGKYLGRRELGDFVGGDL